MQQEDIAQEMWRIVTTENIPPNTSKEQWVNQWPTPEEAQAHNLDRPISSKSYHQINFIISESFRSAYDAIVYRVANPNKSSQEIFNHYCYLLEIRTKEAGHYG